MMMKRFYQSRRANALFVSVTFVALVFFVAYHKQIFRHGFTYTSKDLREKHNKNDDKNRLKNDEVINVDHMDIIPNGRYADIKQTNTERKQNNIENIDVSANDLGAHSFLLVNNSLEVKTNTKMSNGINSVADNIENTQNSNSINSVADNIPNTQNSNSINSVADNIPNTQNSNIINSVADNIPNTQNSNSMNSVADNILNRLPFIPEVPGRISDTHLTNIINKIPDTQFLPYLRTDNVPEIRHHLDPAKYNPTKYHIDTGNVKKVVELLQVKTPAIANSDSMFTRKLIRDSRISGETNGSSLVLLLTYLRSGSTLTADIIQQVPGMFYAFEPLKRYITTDVGYISLNGICSMNSLSCRKPIIASEQPNLFMEDIVRYYGCDLEHVAGPFLWSENSDSVKQYKDCTRAAAQLNADNHFCLHQCFISTRYLKTIRLSMDVAEILMQIIPNLKVIHLLRDPRGMIDSRRRGMFLKKGMDIAVAARSICQRFERDIEIARELRRKYPGRLKTVLYEQIAEYPKLASESLFKFLGLTAPANFDAWLYNHTAAGTRGKYYGTTRANSKLTARLWRHRMSYEDVTKVDNECPIFYNYTGILKVQSEKSLRNLNSQLRMPNSEFGDFL
ncbi:carbohydrate sulfotransferase 3-like [Ylistrum balloti]|uniref:carbohydrate sulfotransferase 3-like n=1 Tax=Ylistrum balloti TaxID=509963 RepID=UPI002905D123|nr:carbohydrate sulfotransferase 3-like [Ylistrum balloti]